MNKKLLSIVAICAIIFLFGCSKIEQNNDPIIGIWAQSESISTESTAKNATRIEWIFNDVYLGRYHEIAGNTILVQTDFSWHKNDSIYTVEYRGLKNKPNHLLTIKATSDEDTIYLESLDGSTVAKRE